MRVEVVDNHSVIVDVLRGGPVLDAGARGFVFAQHFAERGHRVIALDPDPDVEDPEIVGVNFMRYGIAAKSATRLLEMTEDPSARRLVRLSYVADTTRRTWTAYAFSIADLTAAVGQLRIFGWDLVKLNVEGEETDILAAWPGPIARQIVVSFHQHTDYKRPVAEIDAALDHMRQWYDVISHESTDRYCAGFNWWDTQLLLKGVADGL